MYSGPIIKQQLTPYLPSSPVILEAGAHIGRDTIKMIAIWPQATIHAFEPVPYLYDQLVERTAPYSSIHTYPIALSNRTGTEEFYVSSGASTAVSSLYEPYEYLKARPEVTFTKTIVPTIKLDEWASQFGVSTIDFMWLDMQGAELKVLRESTIIVPTVKVLIIEVSLTQRFKGIPHYDEVVSFLESNDFKIIQKDEPRHNKCNLVCIR